MADSIDPRLLFSSDPLPAFESGAVAELVRRRNSAVGSLLSSDRALIYTQIVYRMLLMRRGHELEPLHEDLYRAVASAQEKVSGQPYSADQFNFDMHQLTDWELVTVRLEKERIRGYRDTRRTKYRYGLCGDTIHFLQWLEERLQDDLEDRAPDARDLLEELCGTVRELVRLLRSLARRAPEETEARRILFQVYKSENITQDIASSLVEFNARMLGFLVCEYDIGELRDLLGALRDYVNRYLGRIASLRGELLDDLRRLRGKRYTERLHTAHELMETQRRNAPRLLRTTGQRTDPAAVALDLYRFFRDEGTLDSLCHRINASALHVWQRMSSHLKELERRSHRIADIRRRISEMARLPDHSAPSSWLASLLSWAHMRGDMHYWTHEEMADPPRPRRTSWKQRRGPATILHPKPPAGTVVHSMEQQRLNRLVAWLGEAGLAGDFDRALISGGVFHCSEDLQRIIELARAGILGSGRKLRSVGYRLEPLDSTAVLQARRSRLRCPEMALHRDGKER